MMSEKDTAPSETPTDLDAASGEKKETLDPDFYLNLDKAVNAIAQPLSQRPKDFKYLDWNHLRTFYFVATFKSFSDAARYLHLNQSGLSRTIINFEKTLSTRLFIRGVSPLKLTRAGDIVYKIAAQNFHSIETLVTQIQEDQDLEQGDIRVWAGAGFLSHYLLPYAITFAQQYPDIRLLMTSSKLMPELELLEADVVIRPYLPHRSDLVQTPLLTNHVKLYAGRDYLDKFGTPQTLEDLDHHRLIAYGHSPGSADYEAMNWHLKAGRPADQERKSYIEVDQPEHRLELATAGLGITTISQEHPYLGGHYNLVEVLADFPKPTIACCYIYSRHLQAVKRIQLLENFLVTHFTYDYGVSTL